MTTTVHIAVDCMSGDFGPRSNLSGVVNVLYKYSDVHLHLCGSESDIKSAVPTSLTDKITIYPCDHLISADLKPSAALRMKETTSLHKALDLVATKVASIIVSSANTGAYMALSLKKVGLISNVKRPAIGKIVPSLYKESVCAQTLLLDLGANVNCTADILISFAAVAKDYLLKTQQITNPKVGVLNIGSEAGKGTEELQKTFDILSETTGIKFVGFVEGDQLLQGVADIIISDGFHGNIALKTMEGTIKAFYHILKTTMNQSSIRSKILGLLLGNQLKQTFGETYHPKRFNGALFLGLNGNVIKSHGGADAEAFAYAIITAYEIAKPHYT
jgi:glycerol-3-phosphate acyltransferase PlsX